MGAALMRLAFCIFKYFPYGGIQRDLMKMVRECLARGHEVRIYAIRWRHDGGLPENVQLCLAPVRAMTNHRLYARFAAWVQADLKRRPADLVVGMNKMPGLDVHYAGDTCYQDKARKQRRFWHRLTPRHFALLQAERAVFAPPSTTEILTISEAQASNYQAYYGTPSERFHALPPGIERDRTAPANKDAMRRRLRETLGLRAGEHMLLFVGSGFVKKGLDRLLKGLAALPKQILAASSLYVLGDDSAKPFKRLAIRLGVAEHVRFLGGRADVPDFLLAADGFVLPAYDETAGMAILEAMIAGTPALVTACCGYAPYVQRADAGLVVPEPFDQERFNAQLAELLTSNRRAVWAKNGAALANDPSIHQLAPTAVDLLERFAVRKPASAAQPPCPLAEFHLSPALAQQFAAQELFAWAQAADGEIHRQVKGRSTLRVLLNDRAYFLKRHQGVGWGEMFKNWMVGKRPVLGAENECRACLHLAEQGVKAPKVAAFAMQRGSPAKRASFVLCEELAGFDSLETITNGWAKEPPSCKAKRRLAQAVAHFVRRLHQAGVAHRDLYICHLLLHRQQWAQGIAELAVLDLHRARLEAPVPACWRKRDLAALLFSTLELDLPRSCRLRFLRTYTGRGLREEWQAHGRFWRSVERRAQALQRKARRKQTGAPARQPTCYGNGGQEERDIGRGKEIGEEGDDGLTPLKRIRWGDETVEMVRVLRELPGRRTTALGRLRSEEVVVKLFFGPRAKRYWARERRAARRLAASGVATPRLLDDLPAPQARGWALLFEHLPNARPIAPGPGMRSDAEALKAVEILAQLHEQGLSQRDPHLDNFLAAGGDSKLDGRRAGRVHIIDAGRVGRISRTSQRSGLKALARFLAQYPPAVDGRAARRLACYERARGWDADPARFPSLRRWLALERNRRVRRYLAKTERNCTEFAILKSWRRRCLFRRGRRGGGPAGVAQPASGTNVEPRSRQRLDAALVRFAQDPESALAHAEVVKAGNSATVFRLQLGGEPVIVKRYNIKGPIHRVRRWLKRRPLIAWRNGHRLALLQIPTAIPLALSERRWGPFLGECLLVLQDKDGLDLAAEIRRGVWPPGRLDQLVALFQQLAAAGLGHGDAKASNFLVHGEQVCCIDLDGMSTSRDPGADVHRFLENFQGALREEAQAAFAAAGLIEARPQPTADGA